MTSRRPRPLLVAVAVTLAVTLAARLLPDSWAGTAVGAVFLVATYLSALRGDAARAEHYGLALGGLLLTEPLSARRLARDAARALGAAALTALLIFPPFIVAWRWWWAPLGSFAWQPPPQLWDDVSAQLLAIALPEEAFYRGYLQTALDDRLGTRRRVLGAPLGWGLVLTSLIFAVGHFATEANPARLAVFFPSLLFGWLRARTGGIGASLLLHAASNLLTLTLARSYGLLH